MGLGLKIFQSFGYFLIRELNLNEIVIDIKVNDIAIANCCKRAADSALGLIGVRVNALSAIFESSPAMNL